MARELSTEEFWEIYELLPEKLQNAVFSHDTSESIMAACSTAGIQDGRERDVARFTGRVLLGLIPPEEFAATLEKEVADLDSEQADTIATYIDRNVFEPIRSELNILYEKGKQRGTT